MDDQNQPNSQLNDQPKKDEQDVTSSAPVEMEPETQSSTPPVSQTSSNTSSMPPMDKPDMPSMPQQSTMPTSTPTPLPAPEKPEGLLEAPKKKNSMYIALIAVALVIALGFLGYMVYKTLYP